MTDNDTTSSPRQAQAAANEGFMRRWSPRSMTGEALTERDLLPLFEAARWAPSCFNSQPWRFVYALPGTPAWHPTLDLLIEFNQLWAGKAGALVAIISRTQYEASGESAPKHSFDTGAAWMSFALQAQHSGLVTHAMWGFHHDEAKAALNLSDAYTVEAMVAVGRQGPVSALPEPFRERETPNERKDLSELVFAGQMPAE